MIGFLAATANQSDEIGPLAIGVVMVFALGWYLSKRRSVVLMVLTYAGLLGFTIWSKNQSGDDWINDEGANLFPYVILVNAAVTLLIAWVLYPSTRAPKPTRKNRKGHAH